MLCPRGLCRWSAAARAAASALTVVLAVAGCGVAHAPSPHLIAARPAGAQDYWGAKIGTQFGALPPPYDMAALASFRRAVGRAPSIVAFNIPFEGCSSSCNYYSFPETQLQAIRNYGAIPMLNWGSESSPSSADEPDFRLANVTSGRFDAYIRSFALEAKAWGHPLFLRFDWEMNGNWFPWAQAANGNNPGDFVAAWRHVHDIFNSVGASNVTWVWCPAVDPRDEFTGLEELYPGDAYVDWSCLDGYNTGSDEGKGRWLSFAQIYSNSYREIVEHVAPDKPLIIGEVASSEHGGSKAAWIANMLATLPSAYPQIRAFVWFDVPEKSADWPIESSAASLAAFSRGIKAGPYTTNGYRHLAARPIAPPP
jgi:Glycosyl hydrolase family 26